MTDSEFTGPEDTDATGDVSPDKPKRTPLFVGAADALRRRILSGELPPGARLREVRLCNELGVSRTPLREAFRALAAEGLVEILPNRSVVVSKFHSPDIEDLIVVFASIEALAGELACSRVTSEQLAAVGNLYTQMVECYQRGERSAYLDLNMKIHSMTVEIADNPILLGIWKSLLPRMQRARALPNLRPEHWSDAVLQHTKMFAALASRNGPLLAQLTREHFLDILPNLPDEGEPPDA
jgi:DNA-binding GntR family transcriptional regulator